MADIDIFQVMMDDEFQDILANDKVLDELQKQKHNERDQFFQTMMVLSKVFKIGDIVVSCITPSIWMYLYGIGNAYTRSDRQVTNSDTDIFMYILNKGVKNMNSNFLDESLGFCAEHGLNYIQTEYDLKNLIYLSFRPLEMLDGYASSKKQQIRYNVDWLTKLVAVVAPLTNKTADDIIYNTSLTQCYYYYIQKARQFDDKGIIKRKNSDQINQAIYLRTLQLGKQYYQEKYGDKKK